MWSFEKYILFSFLLLSFTQALYAVSGKTYTPEYVEPLSEQWRWQNFPELSGKGPRCMVEEKYGVLWFGVNGGVIKYDGVNWDFYSLAKDSSDTPVIALCVSKDGIIYAGTTDGLYKYENSIWEAVPIKLDFGDEADFPHNKIPMLATEDKSVWIGTREGLLRIKNNEMTLYTERRLYNNFEEALPPFDIYSICEEKPGTFWIGLRDGRIYKCSFKDSQMDSTPAWRRIDVDKGYVKATFPMIERNSRGQVFIVSGKGTGMLNVYKDKKWEQQSFKDRFGVDDKHTSVLKLKDGSVLVAGLGRVFIFKSNKWRMFENPALPFPPNRLVVYQTKNEGLWVIGVSNEVWRIDLSYKRWITIKDLLFQTEDHNGNKWFIRSDGVVVKSDSLMKEWITYDRSDGLMELASVIFVTKRGVVWAGGSHKQSAATAYFNGEKWIKQLNPQLGWGIDRRAVYETNKGSLWFGSCTDPFFEKGQIGGLIEYTFKGDGDDGKIDYNYHYADDNFKLRSIYGMGETKGNILWAGQLGFYSYNQSTHIWKKITEPHGLDENFVDCISTSSYGDLWVGTRTNGLFCLNNKTGKWEHFTIKNGLSSNTIVNILTEKNGSVWVATDRDIAYFDGKNWTGKAFSGFFKPKMDGIAIKSTKDGSIWINQNPPAWYRIPLYNEALSKEALAGFKTVRYTLDKMPPETFITFSQERIAQPGNVILSWSAVDPWKYTTTEQIQYSYRIDDNPWSPFTNKTNEIFLAVPDGNHTFEVRARDLDFNVDLTPEKIEFYVIPPIWKQTWFILLILFFLSIILFFIIYLYQRNKIIYQISETKSRLFANISHELRTPLTLIIGPLEKALASPLLNKEILSLLNLANKNCHRLLRLTNQVLDFRKIEANQLKFEPAHGDIIEFLREEVNVFNESAESKKIELQFETNLNELYILFDKDKIEKIIFNLMTNALKYTNSRGSILVKVSLKNCKEEKSIEFNSHGPIKFNKNLEIVVSDTGIGIPQEDIPKIFDRFYQIEGHSKTAVGGTGIGLSIVKELVRIHFGEINVESCLGKGTTFIIKIPVLEEDIAERKEQEQVFEEPDVPKLKAVEKELPDLEKIANQLDKQRSKILIVEDNEDMRKYITGELENEYRLIEAVDGYDGFQKAIQFGPDLIISDIMMPRMDGIDFCKKIKTNEETSHIALIMLTARSSQKNKLEGLETGADDYITKPFNSNELLLKIRNIIERQNKFREKFNSSLQLEPSNVKITSVDQKFLKRVIEIIEDNLDNPEFNVEMFSRLVGMSRVGLYNKLKALTNHSVQEFIFVIRLKRAAQLLKESGMSITEITYQVGFKDPSHFSKLFKKQYGMSPKAFMKEHEN
jgi:signal transduction histidine kinase/DNA-binding response OmpR family regulator